MGRFTDYLEEDKRRIEEAMKMQQRAAIQAEVGPDDWYWEVIGGEDKGGIVVRKEEDACSERFVERLSFGARVRELEVVGNRMRYHKLMGDGPNSGWVCMTFQEKELLRKVEIFALPEHDVELEEKEELERQAKLKSIRIEPPAEFPPEVSGKGFLYDVVARQVAVRAAPSLAAPAQFQERKGATVEMFDWDETRMWRMVVDRCNRIGWMMLDHPQLGPLLRPKGLPFQREPLSPLCVAAMEGDLFHTRQFIEAGVDLNEPDSGGHTPMMHAAKADNVDIVVVLLKEGANSRALNYAGRTAVELAASEVIKHLIQALTLREFNPTLIMEGVGRMDPEVQQVAQKLLQIPIRLERERQEQEAARATAPLQDAGGFEQEGEEDEEGTGERWEVVYKQVPVRSDPTTVKSKIVSSVKMGDVLHALDYDDSGRWIKISCRWRDHKERVDHKTGWVLTEHRDLGIQLQRI